MANYEGTTKTNYFRTTNAEELESIINNIVSEDDIHLSSREINNELYFSFSTMGDIGGVYIEEDEDYDYDLMCEQLQKVVHPEDAIIITSVGNEKLRYVAGDSTIITVNGVEHINIWNESQKVAKKLLNNPNYDFECSY